MKRHRAPRHQTRWTPRDDRRLAWAWGATNVGTIAKNLGRSKEATRVRAHKLGLPSVGTGYYTLRDVSRITGYRHDALLTLAERLGLKLRRRPMVMPRIKDHRRRPYAIDIDQLDAMVDEITRLGGRPMINGPAEAGSWGGHRKPDACGICGTSERPHRARGLCYRCYKRVWRSGHLDDYPPIVPTHARVVAA